MSGPGALLGFQEEQGSEKGLYLLRNETVFPSAPCASQFFFAGVNIILIVCVDG